MFPLNWRLVSDYCAASLSELYELRLTIEPLSSYPSLQVIYFWFAKSEREPGNLSQINSGLQTKQYAP